MAVSTPTVPRFPRFDPPIDSRSPSRSPRRKAQFAIKELDPLLGNLSPDSTLKALQATEIIPGGPAQDALASSIGDATPAEREIGIRAAFAAQKIREWRNELSQWSWPGKRERTLGLGFIPPREARQADTEYRGYLPESLAEQYDARLEEIRDNLDSLGMEDIKDHVLEAHVPSASSPASPRFPSVRTSYGRMRDFTALITATVIQALPDLAKLNALLDTWDIRLRVLRALPTFLPAMQSTELAIEAAFKEIRDVELAQQVTAETLESRKLVLGGRVSDLGRWIDRLLDMLEGQEDSLPQSWIDKLEKIELDYATWVVDAQHLVLQNELLAKKVEASGDVTMLTSRDFERSGPGEADHEKEVVPEPQISHLPGPFDGHSKTPDSPITTHVASRPKQKPSLKLDLPDQKGHKREISKVSIADSTYSTFSDISNAEIMDARTTSVLPSPKISLVENPFRTSRDELTWFGNSSAAQQQMATRPPVLQRASTASIEVVPKDQLREVMLRRTVSWDMLSQIPSSPESTPTKALRQLTGSASPGPKIAMPELEADFPSQSSSVRSADTSPLATPSLQVEPLHIQSKDQHPDTQLLPSLPRRSSKRAAVSGYALSSPRELLATQSTTPQESVQKAHTQKVFKQSPEASSPKTPRTVESLDDKIQDILTTLPTRIRLAKDTASLNSVQPSSKSSTRSSTPTPSLTLTPAKLEPSSRQSSTTDPDVSVYHLRRTGQHRDVPPVKLFVRTVGEGGRVMVRVGGGWADLGEYLKEYSLHHGGRAAVDGRLEVTSFPSSGQKDSALTTSGAGASASQVRRKTNSPSAIQTTFGHTSSPDPPNPGRRTSSRPRSPELSRKSPRTAESWTPPPVPPIPSTFNTPSSAVKAATEAGRGTATSGKVQEKGSTTVKSPQPSDSGGWPASVRSSVTTSSSGVTTTTVMTPPITTTNYTPLGAAGPKPTGRRVASIGASNDAWVEGMVGKARVVSGGSSNMVHGPTTTTTTSTTTTITSSTPTTRRASYFGSSPSSNSSPVTVSSSPSVSSAASDAKSRRASLAMRPKSRLSLGDMSGIRRVFLRRKSDQAVR
ncbi:hypothetical protein ABEF95_011552 [Exophiala dermatitidis]